MKLLLALLALMLCVCPAVAQQSGDLKTAVATVFSASHREGKTKYTLSDFIDNKLPSVSDEKIRADFSRYVAVWQKEFAVAAKLSADTAADKMLLSYVQAANVGIEAAKGDKARIDEAKRKLIELRRRVAP